MTDICTECDGEKLIYVGRGEKTWTECCPICNAFGDEPDEDYEYG